MAQTDWPNFQTDWPNFQICKFGMNIIYHSFYDKFIKHVDIAMLYFVDLVNTVMSQVVYSMPGTSVCSDGSK